MASSLVSSFTGLQLGCNCGTARLLSARPAPARFSPAVAPIEAAHKKGAGSTKNGRDSNSKRRGVKVYGGQAVGAGGIIVRQLGTHVRPPAAALHPVTQHAKSAKDAGVLPHATGSLHATASRVPLPRAVPPRAGRGPREGLHAVRHAAWRRRFPHDEVQERRESATQHVPLFSAMHRRWHVLHIIHTSRTCR